MLLVCLASFFLLVVLGLYELQESKKSVKAFVDHLSKKLEEDQKETLTRQAEAGPATMSASGPKLPARLNLPKVSLHF